MIYEVTRTALRENQYEIFCNISDDAGSLIIGNFIHPIGKKILTGAALDRLVEAEIFPIFSAPPDEPERFYTADEITNILREKNYLTAEQEFSED